MVALIYSNISYLKWVSKLKPLIGITCSQDTASDRFYLPRYYARAVEMAGGIPLLLSPVSAKSCTRLLGIVQGILLSGGVDVDPIFFGEEPHPQLGEITPERDGFEIGLVRLALKRNVPIFGICRGAQVLNIAAGGTVLQHIPAEIKDPLKHSQDAPRWYATHNVSVVCDTILSTIAEQGMLRVNSFHHQAVKNVAVGFKTSARSSDGVIEAIESTRNKFAVGVQWHPECMIEHDPLAVKLFTVFIDACK